LRPREAPPLLTTREQKERLAEEAGLDFLLILAFDQELAARSALEFARRFLSQQLRLRELHVGAGFHFGRRREGDVAMLAALAGELGFTTHGVDEVLWEGERISSSRIREALLAGRVEDALAMLGRPYELVGKVLRGDRMGQKLGWPTINLRLDSELVPRDGVYATRVQLPGFPLPFDAATNIGTRPTVYENFHRVVESHILDFASDVYGQVVALRFYKRLREERIFPSIMDLSAQIGRDVEATREHFAALRRRETESGVTPAVGN
ncbi:MAG TPA: riboflavin biosynthesis protein RibF, partial [Thermoanaerobaculia bacterium]|nr:riboflavin biosynthesis protein RibF [Thermoanaerobaculia bacterium]